MLSNKEAISLCLYLSPKYRINSTTKLNKIVASLNINAIPVNLIFRLNKNGSHCQELTENCEQIVLKKEYPYKDGKGYLFELNDNGVKLAESVLQEKITPLFENEEIEKLKHSIEYFNSLDSYSLSNFEHIKLKVNVEDRFKLKQDSNSLNIDYLDLYDNFKKSKSESFELIDIKGITQFYFVISSFLRESFNRQDDYIYDFGTPMCQYYLFFLLKDQLDILQKPLASLIKDENRYLTHLNRGYAAIKELIELYEFPISLDNLNLSDVIGKLKLSS